MRNASLLDLDVDEVTGCRYCQVQDSNAAIICDGCEGEYHLTVPLFFVSWLSFFLASDFF